MLRSLFNFQRVNWWVLLSGAGFNLIITLVTALVGAYLANNESTAEAYARWGQPLIMLAIFLLCGVTGWLVAKIADDVPLKHAFLAGMGAFLPFLTMAMLTFSPIFLMLAVVALAGALNGGLLGVPRRHYRPEN